MKLAENRKPCRTHTQSDVLAHVGAGDLRRAPLPQTWASACCNAGDPQADIRATLYVARLVVRVSWSNVVVILSGFVTARRRIRLLSSFLRRN